MIRLRAVEDLTEGDRVLGMDRGLVARVTRHEDTVRVWFRDGASYVDREVGGQMVVVTDEAGPA